MSRARSVTAGQRFGSLVVLAAPHRRRAACRCDCGATRDVLVSNLRAGSVSQCGAHDGGAHIPRGYGRAHSDLARLRGPARAYRCAYCGTAAAEEWSLTEQAPHRYDSPGGYAYSADVADYVPACRSCHRRADAQAAQRRQARERGRIPLPGLAEDEGTAW